MRHVWIILLILPFALPAQRTLIADDAEIGDSLSLAGEWISLIRKDTNFWASTHGEVPSTRAILEWFGAQSAGIPGTGNEGSLTYWDSDSTLAYINVSYTATELNASALTGSFQWPTGTTAQQPVGANGKTRFNLTTGLFEGYHAAAYRPFATFDGIRTSGYVPFWNGTTLTSSAELIYSSNELRINSADKGSFKLQVEGGMVMGGSTPSLWDVYAGSQQVVRFYNSHPSGLMAIMAEAQSAGVGAQILNSASTGVALEIGQGNNYNGTSITDVIRIGNKKYNTDYYNHTYLGTGSAKAILWRYGQQGASGGCRGGNMTSYNAARLAPVVYESNCDTVYIDIDTYARHGLTFPVVHRIRKGQLFMPFYGTGTFSGSLSYVIGTNASGAFIEKTPADIVAAGSFTAYGEYYAADTLSITSGTPIKLQGGAAGIVSNVTHSSSRLTYTGSSTYTFSVDFSASIDASTGAEVSFWVYKNGSPVSSSKQVHKITPGEINVVSTGCFVSLAQNDYVEVFFDVDTSCDVYIRNSNLKIKKI